MWKDIRKVTVLLTICFAAIAPGFVKAVVRAGNEPQTITEFKAAVQETEQETEVIAPVKNIRPVEHTKVSYTMSDTAPNPEYEPVIQCAWNEDIILTSAEYELLCTLTYCESGNQELETQTMVALTVLNRLTAGGEFGDTIEEVIYKDGAYAVTKWEGFEDYDCTELTRQAVREALRENNYPSDMYYFRTLHYHGFGVPYRQSGDLWFSVEPETEEM